MEKLVLGVCMPRSGSTHLAALLSDIAGPRLSVASWPAREGDVLSAEVVFARTHDDDFELDRRPEVPYVISHREPRGRILSQAEWHVRLKPDIRKAFEAKNRSAIGKWLSMHERYAVGFYKKWLDSPPPLSLLVDYQALLNEPAEVLVRALRLIGIEEPHEKILASCDRLARFLPNSARRFVARDVSLSPYIPQDLLDEHVERVQSLCPIWRSEPGRLSEPHASMTVRPKRSRSRAIGRSKLEMALATVPARALPGTVSPRDRPSGLSVIVVLGMHRSGTSLVSNVLHYLGADMADSSDRASVKNPGGFWERPDLVALHDEVLTAIGRPVSSPIHSAPFPAGWWRSKEVQAIKDRMRLYLEDVLANAHGWWGFKDPRTCRLLPLWKELFEEFGIRPHYVWAIRAPGEAAASMAAKNPAARPMSPEQAELTWLAYNYDLLRYTLDSRPLVIGYREWFTDAIAVGRRILQRLDLPGFATENELADALTRIVRPEFRNYVEGKDEASASIPLAQTLFDELSELARSQEPDYPRLRRYIAMLDVTFRVVTPVIAPLGDLPVLRQKAQELEEAQELLRQMRLDDRAVRQRLESRKQRIEAQEKELEAVRAQLGSAEKSAADIAKLDSEAKKLKTELTEAARREASERKAREEAIAETARLRSSVERLTAELAQSSARVTAWEAEKVAYEKGAAEVADLRSRLERSCVELEKSVADVAHLRSGLEKSNAELSTARLEVRRSAAELAQAAKKVADLEFDRATHQKQRAAFQLEQSESRKVAAEVQRLRSAMKQLETDLRQASAKVVAMEAERAAHRKTTKELETSNRELERLGKQIAAERERASTMEAAEAERRRAGQLDARAQRLLDQKSNQHKAAVARVASLEAKLARVTERRDQLVTACSGYLARIKELKAKTWLGSVPLARSTGTTLRFNGVPGLKGLLDVVDADGIGGWACWPERPSERVKLAFYDGERFMGACTADRMRSDLLKQDFGDGKFAFHLPLPDGLADGKPHRLDIRLAATAQSVLARPIVVTLEAGAGKNEQGQSSRPESPHPKSGSPSPGSA